MFKRLIRNAVLSIIQEISSRPKPVGIALFRSYTSCMGMGTTFAHPDTPYVGGPGFNAFDYHEFTKDDITDDVDGMIKIKGVWFKEDEVFFYSNPALTDYKKVMGVKYPSLGPWTSIHTLYDHGLSVSYGLFGAENHFYDRKLREEIEKKMQEITSK